MKIKKQYIYSSISFILLLSYFFSNCYIEIGFALKPYMIIAVLVLFIMVMIKESPKNYDKIDIYYIIYLLYIVLMLIFSENINASFRYTLGMILVFTCYLINKNLLIKLEKNKFEKILVNVFFIIGIISIIYYFLGAFSLGFCFTTNNINKFGITIDRKIPRLISFASHDPNITSCFFAVPFCFFLCNFNSKKNKIGFFLYLLLIILTLSRGGFIAIFCMLVYYLFTTSKNVNQLFTRIFRITIIAIILLVIVTMVTDKVLNISISNYITSRFNSINVDGGSGRIQLWKYAIESFKEHPLIGIGVNSTLEHNKLIYNNAHYTHNTYLEVLSEQGIGGFIFYLLLLIEVLKKCLQIKKYTLFPLCSYLVILCQNMFLSLFINETFFLILIICCLYNNYYINNGGLK